MSKIAIHDTYIWKRQCLSHSRIPINVDKIIELLRSPFSNHSVIIHAKKKSMDVQASEQKWNKNSILHCPKVHLTFLHPQNTY